jgi:hypothetical protein
MKIKVTRKLIEKTVWIFWIFIKSPAYHPGGWQDGYKRSHLKDTECEIEFMAYPRFGPKEVCVPFKVKLKDLGLKKDFFFGGMLQCRFSRDGDTPYQPTPAQKEFNDAIKKLPGYRVLPPPRWSAREVSDKIFDLIEGETFEIDESYFLRVIDKGFIRLNRKVLEFKKEDSSEIEILGEIPTSEKLPEKISSQWLKVPWVKPVKTVRARYKEMVA